MTPQDVPGSPQAAHRIVQRGGRDHQPTFRTGASTTAEDGVGAEDCEGRGHRRRGPAAPGDDASGAGTGTAKSIQL